MLHKTQKHFAEAERLLYQMGATPNYAGFHYTIHAVLLSVEDSRRLLFVTKFLYPDIASYYHTTWTAVERDIRTLIRIIRKKHPDMLEQLFDDIGAKQPSPGQFLTALTVACLQKMASNQNG